jgi:PTH1 family peptidyl-tRNA hydrolase
MIIFGLGNPGLQYRNTRHNVGHIFLNLLAKHFHKRFIRRNDHYACSLNVKGSALTLIKPISWMNLSGVVIVKLTTKYKDEILVVVDDIALPLGRMRLRARGSDGGHKGLRSIAEHLKTDDFARLRIGVGEPDIDPADYVLSRFSRAEMSLVKKVIDESIKGIEIAVKDGFEKAQNYINGIKIDANG